MQGPVSRARWRRAAPRGGCGALRALLQRPVLHAQTDGELFRLARRHAEELRVWFARETEDRSE